MKALRDLSELQLDQTAPFTAQERARIGLRDDDEAGIILPVPPSAGRLSFKHEGRDPDHCYTYRDATGGVLGDIFRCNAYSGSGKHFQPATFWKGANGKGAWQHKSWPSPRPLSLKRKSASSKISVPRKASRMWKIGETVEAPLAKKPL